MMAFSFVGKNHWKFSLVIIAIILAGVFGLLFSDRLVLAQTAQNVIDRKAVLEQELSRIEAQIAEEQKILDVKAQESVSLARDVAILNAKISQTKLAIKATDLAIQKLDSEINDKQTVIGQLGDKLDREKESIGQLIRKTDEIDEYSLVELVLDNKSVSELFTDLDSFTLIKRALKESLVVVTDTKDTTLEEKISLESKKVDQVSLRALQNLEKKRVEQEEQQKESILKISKGIEAAYQQMIKSERQNAAKIRAELFTLQGSAAIPFEKALELANIASKKTGVRPALILGVIAEESNLGENVGTGNWRVDMKAPRDTAPFVDITSRLGLDPDRMPVSKKPWYGYGGAMGPAQFIPSTWVLYEARIAKATGHNPPNPWDPSDAFMASAILLMDNGADKGTFAAERLAALRYLAGWTNATKKAYAFYGDDVMDLAAKYQKLIDILTNS